VARKAELVRLAAVGPRTETPVRSRTPRRVAIDAACRLPGRGAYLCRAGASDLPRLECLQKALARKTLRRALRQPVDVPVELVESVGR